VVQEDTFSRRERFGTQGIHEAQKPLDLFPVHFMEAGEVQITPTLPVQLIYDQLGGVVGVGKLNPASGRNAASSPPAVPETGTNDADYQKSDA
jgi:hypothetical protein